MNTPQSIEDFQEKFTIQLSANVAKIVSPSNRKELATAYLQMFSGFAWVNWTNKYSLGRAWQMALVQCGTFADTKNKNNPAAQYLNSVYVAHKKYWSRVIMTHGARENLIDTNDKKIKQLRAHGENMIRSAMDKINLIMAQYNERTEELVAEQTNIQTHTTIQHSTNTPQQAQIVPSQVPQTESVPQAIPQTLPQQQPYSMAMPTPQVQATSMPHSTANNQTAQSGAFAIVRNSTQQKNTVIVDKPTTEQRPAPAQFTQTKKHPALKTIEQPTANQSHKQNKTIVRHAEKSVAKPVAQSGALAKIRNTVKQPNVLKQVEKTTDDKKQAPIVKLGPQKQAEFYRAQTQLKLQQQLKIWQLGQFNQHAA